MSISIYTHTQGVWAATGEVWKGAGKKKSSKVYSYILNPKP